PQRWAIARSMLETAQRIPGVQYATLTISVPFWSNEGTGIWVPGVDSVNRKGNFLYNTGSPDYFKTMGTRILKGRAFDERDQAGTELVLVAGERMAALLWPGQDPLGKCVKIGSEKEPCTTVIGVAEEMRLRSLTGEREYSYFIPAVQNTSPPD